MSRYSRLDSDEERLPDGIQRVGYDADTQQYTYQDEDGSYWQSAAGQRYGRLQRSASTTRPGMFAPSTPFSPTPLATSMSSIRPPNSSQPLLTVDGQSHELSDEERAAQNAMLEHGNREAWRTLMPFALLAIVFLLILFKFINSGPSAPTKVECVGDAKPYTMKAGDTCWAIAEKYGADVKGLLEVNKGVDCDKLGVGKKICVPGGK